MHLQEIIQKENKIKKKTSKQKYPDTIKFYKRRKKKMELLKQNKKVL